MVKTIVLNNVWVHKKVTWLVLFLSVVSFSFTGVYTSPPETVTSSSMIVDSLFTGNGLNGLGDNQNDDSQGDEDSESEVLFVYQSFRSSFKQA